MHDEANAPGIGLSRPSISEETRARRERISLLVAEQRERNLQAAERPAWHPPRAGLVQINDWLTAQERLKRIDDTEPLVEIAVRRMNRQAERHPVRTLIFCLVAVLLFAIFFGGPE